ncbi:SAM domain-containing protein [Durusdinium trenchii]|uniref:SAM domain-containing protein n=1 Tax=Durusdinium trenchii TaxID=1381693 RepID=A0ABP0IYU7_9DINO
MGGIRHEDFGYKVPAEQRSLLSRQNYTLRPLSSVGALSVLKVLDVSWQAIAVFIAALLVQSMVHSKPLLIVVLGVFLIFPVMELLVLLIGVVAATIWRGVRWKAVVFWTWWPFWKVVLCVAAACVATSFGNYLWKTSFSINQQIDRMQVYQNINPSNLNATGLRLQDAGVMTFDRASGVNRMMTGCFVDTTTFCIAAITSVTEKDGKLLPQDLSQYDLFMAGTDCCECPGEFRCGDWNVPGAHLGGYRETDAAINKFYSLASQDFAAAYHKTVKYPIFLQWHNDPQQALLDLASTANSNRALVLVVVPVVIVVLVVVLNGLLQLLIFLQVAGPHKPPTGDGMIGRMGRKLHPSMYSFQREEQEATGPATYVQF